MEPGVKVGSIPTVGSNPDILDIPCYRLVCFSEWDIILIESGLTSGLGASLINAPGFLSRSDDTDV